MNVQLAWALVHFLWQGLAIAGILLIALQLLRTAEARYQACAAALALMALAPFATFLWLAPHTTELAGTRGQLLDPADLPALGAVQTNWLESHATWLLTLWLAGACLLLIRSAVAWLRARKLVRVDLTPLPAGLNRAAHRLAGSLGVRGVRFHASARVASALVFGWLKPVIVLPAAAVGRLSEAEIEALLAHELAHVMRQDFLVNILQTFVECMLFYHPCVWWVSARMRHERELCCDDLAVAVCRDEVLYSNALLRLEELRMEPALAATGGRLRDRIRRLLNTPETRRISAAPVVALALLIGVSVALLAQNPPPAPEQPAPPPAAAPAASLAQPPAPPEVPEPPPPPPPGTDKEHHPGEAPPPPQPPPPPPGMGPGVAGRGPGPRAESPDARPDGPGPGPRSGIGSAGPGQGPGPGVGPGGPGPGPGQARGPVGGPMPRPEMTAAQRQEFEKQREAMEKDRQKLAVELEAMVKARVKAAADREVMAQAREQLELALQEQTAKLQSQAGSEAQRQIEELRKRLEAMAKAEAEKAVAEAEQARKEAGLAAREADMARMEADHARMEADQARLEAELKRLEADRLKAASQAEMDRRRQYAKDRFGGENTDRGRIYMQYGPPDEIEVHPGQGEFWRYEGNRRGGATLDFEFDASGKLVRRSGRGQARLEQDRGMQFADELRAGEQDRRTKYANEKWASQGGANSDKGRAYIKYGPPDEIQTKAGGGETWLYKNDAKDEVRMEVSFDATGKGQRVQTNTNAGALRSGLSYAFQDAPGLK